ncbi:MAG: hypothetical protein GTO71_10495 [Woeseiaceae bacterium]|nr:hypothetical protein [Woeseiaceae bacterium]NIP21502.1 hypothetical protein [Woeseiaceae bacterium]NIS90490.1 hypothetical protein [Woeseiaceae bacterium]
MTKMTKIVTASFLFLLAQGAIACNYPDRPAVPDGATASKEDLLAAKAAVQEFMTNVDDYLMCIEGEEKAAIADMDNPTPEELQRRDEMLNKRFEAANDEKALLGEQFNQQIRVYNAKVQADKE